MGQRERLHRLVEELPGGEMAAAERYLEYLQLVGRDPVLHALLTAPYDDEPESDEERAGLAEAEEDYRAGRIYTLDEVKRDLGL